MQPNILLLVLDSHRYDVAEIEMRARRTPNLAHLFAQAAAGGWRRVFAQGTYTLPAHISMFHSGFLPDNRLLDEPVYNRSIRGAWRCQFDLHGPRDVLFSLPSAPSVMEGFSAEGYTTLGIGGVGWFDLRLPTAQLWNKYFQYLAWDESFHENHPDSLEKQIACAQAILSIPPPPPLFLFWNVTATHSPFCGHERSIEGQGKALQYIDVHIPAIIGIMKKPCHVFIMGDHGECFGEDGLWGHGFHHEKVMEVPLIHFLLEKEVVW
jgi:hypothetical protein